MIWVALVVGCYALGSISWSYLIVRGLQGVDVRSVGSGSAGATNVLRISGTWPALTALVLDVAKGLVAVAVALVSGAPGPVAGASALAVVLGHIFPVFHGLRGGKGVATALGALAALAALPAALAALVFLVVILTTRYVSLGSITGVLAFPLAAWLCGRAGWSEEAPGWLLVAALSIAIVIIFKHHDNIRRLRDGKEAKLGRPRRREEAT